MAEQKININVEPKDLKGVYSNSMRISHSREEFCLDFFNLFPPVGTLTARVITSPAHLKKILKAMQYNLAEYEKKFGATYEAQDLGEPEIGPAQNK